MCEVDGEETCDGDDNDCDGEIDEGELCASEGLALECFQESELLVNITKHVVNSRIKSFQVDFDIGQLPKLTVCPSEVCFILSILLTNAADALEAVKVEHKDRRAFFDGKISVKAHTDSHKDVSGIIIVVEDNGGGITSEEWDKFLEPYMTNRSEANSGLGLTICKALVQKNRGQMWLADAPLLGGARIKIFFPAS